MKHLKGGKNEKIWRNMLLSLPAALRHSAAGKLQDLSASGKLHLSRQALDWNETAACFVRAELEDQLRRKGQGEPARFQLNRETAGGLTGKEEEILADTALAVKRDNRSNLTRTAAYLKLYREFPELHWAFLAHMVSRNAGWNMSDLKGSQTELLLEDSDIYRTYRFLERSNALIFQDAYPQLLLYAHSKRHGKSFFHLLPCFHVSRFMQPFWDYFWLSRSSSLLAVGLIINEQNYIEKRVVQHPFFQQKVMRTAPFRLGAWSGINQLLLPFTAPSGGNTGEPRLAGRTMRNFSSLDARIGIGKHLYTILFGLQEVLRGAGQFAFSTPHTGSRVDYWPGQFAACPEEAEGAPSQGMGLLRTPLASKESASPIYSPRLLDVYEDTPYEPVTREDWFVSGECLPQISTPACPLLCEMTGAHRIDLLKRAYAHDAAAGIHRYKVSKSNSR
ncbi:DUF2515 family protein [Paenibacillus pinistramenti]|uniref:DUF2515 family protein n=1 Tax=Paenibacillus pinistramenti TaxID=1768003 RepID=UPI00110802FB|nr:DUF2515 family protein [Paenibacillus pinistramenti]